MITQNLSVIFLSLMLTVIFVIAIKKDAREASLARKGENTSPVNLDQNNH